MEIAPEVSATIVSIDDLIRSMSEGRRQAQLKYWAKLPLYEKIAWLEDAQRMIQFLSREKEEAGAQAVEVTGGDAHDPPNQAHAP